MKESSKEKHDLSTTSLTFPPVSRPALLTKEQLRQVLNLPSTRGVDELVRRRVISAIRLGWRTVRFDLSTVLKELERVTVRSISI
jgi:hypothetical protein